MSRPQPLDKTKAVYGQSNEFISPYSHEEMVKRSLTASKSTPHPLKEAYCPYCYDGVIYFSKYEGYKCYACGKKIRMEKEE